MKPIVIRIGWKRDYILCLDKRMKGFDYKSLHGFDKKPSRRCISCSTAVFPEVCVDRRPTWEQWRWLEARHRTTQGNLREREAQKAQDNFRSPSFSCLGSLIKFAYWYVVLDMKYVVEIRRGAEMWRLCYWKECSIESLERWHFS